MTTAVMEEEVAMGLPWVRLDTQFPQNPKILDLVEAKKYRAALAWVCSLAYTGAHGTGGFIPTSCLAFLHATKADAADLVQVELWDVCPGGWAINGWLEFQPVTSEDEARRVKYSERGRKGAAARWEKANQAKPKHA